MIALLPEPVVVRFNCAVIAVTSMLACGATVPMPTFPEPSTIKSVVVATAAEDELTKKSGLFVAAFALETESVAYGEVVPIPTFVPVLL
jgi:hypothetical protein